MIHRKVSHNFILFLQNDDNHFFKMMAIIIQRNVTQNFIQLLQNDDKRKKLYINRIFFTSIVIKLYLYLDVTSWKWMKEWWRMKNDRWNFKLLRGFGYRWTDPAMDICDFATDKNWHLNEEKLQKYDKQDIQISN